MNIFTWHTLFTIDQIDNNVAFVEWNNESISVIHVDWLPEGAQEGNTMQLSLTPVRRSNCHFVQQDISRSVWIECNPQQNLYLPVSPPWSNLQGLVWTVTTIEKMGQKKNL